MASVQYNIEAENGVAKVTSTKGAGKLKKGDMITFKANGPTTAIRFSQSSPFVHPQAGKTLLIGSGQGPFEVVNGGDHQFDCGDFVSGKFTNWAGGGSKTPVEN